MRTKKSVGIQKCCNSYWILSLTFAYRFRGVHCGSSKKGHELLFYEWKRHKSDGDNLSFFAFALGQGNPLKRQFYVNHLKGVKQYAYKKI